MSEVLIPCICGARINASGILKHHENCEEAKAFNAQFIWLHPVVKILCDFGQCEKASLVQCVKCKACLCLEHPVKHVRTCSSSLDTYARMRFEQEILDGKVWV